MNQETQLYVPRNIAKRCIFFYQNQHTIIFDGIVICKQKLEKLFSQGMVSQFKKKATEIIKKGESWYELSTLMKPLVHAIIEDRKISFDVFFYTAPEENYSPNNSLMKCLLEIDFTRLKKIDLKSKNLVSIQAFGLIDLPQLEQLILNKINIKNYKSLAKSNFRSLLRSSLDCGWDLTQPIRRMQNYQLKIYNLNSRIKRIPNNINSKQYILTMKDEFEFWFQSTYSFNKDI